MFFELLKSFFISKTDVFGFGYNFLVYRSIICFCFSFLITFFVLKFLINTFKKHKFFQPIRLTSFQHFKSKKNIPTFGGLACCLGIFISTLLFSNLNEYIVFSLFIAAIFAFIGLIDDILKTIFHNTDGVDGKIKIIIETIMCGIAILLLSKYDTNLFTKTHIFIPFFHYMLYLGILMIPFLIFVIIGSSNAVNLTDGLDGLAIVPIILCALSFFVILIYNDNMYLSTSFDIKELSTLCSSIVGSGLAFLMFNRYPAKIFMGDVGSLMYGSLLGCIAIISGYEIFYGIIGLVFVLEAMSDMGQFISINVFHKRLFKIAPLHHTFEEYGWSERKIVYTFWIFTLICVLIGILGVIKIG